MQCPACRHPLTAEALTCAKCGRPLARPGPRRSAADPDKTEFLSVDPQRSQKTQIVQVQLPGQVRRAMRQADGGDGSQKDQDESINLGLRDFYGRLHRLDRITLWSLLLGFVATFLPFAKVRGEGWVAGIEGVGIINTLALVVTFGLIYARTIRRRLATTFLLLQLGSSALACAVPVFMLTAQSAAQRSLGAALAAISSFCVLLFTLARLLRTS